MKLPNIEFGKLDDREKVVMHNEQIAAQLTTAFVTGMYFMSDEQQREYTSIKEIYRSMLDELNKGEICP